MSEKKTVNLDAVDRLVDSFGKYAMNANMALQNAIGIDEPRNTQLYKDILETMTVFTSEILEMMKGNSEYEE